MLRVFSREACSPEAAIEVEDSSYMLSPFRCRRAARQSRRFARSMKLLQAVLTSMLSLPLRLQASRTRASQASGTSCAPATSAGGRQFDRVAQLHTSVQLTAVRVLSCRSPRQTAVFLPSCMLLQKSNSKA